MITKLGQTPGDNPDPGYTSSPHFPKKNELDFPNYKNEDKEGHASVSHFVQGAVPKQT